MGVKHLKYQLLSLLLLLYLGIRGQECEWLETGIGTNSQNSNSVTVDKSNNKIICGSYRDTFSITNFSNTFKFTRPTASSGFESNALIIKYDSDGKILWVNQTTRNSTSSSCFYRDVTTDTKGDIYVSVEYKGNISFGNGISATAPTTGSGYLAVLKYNENGVAQWIRTLTPNNFVFTGKLASDNSDNVILGFTYRGTIDFSGTTQSITSSGTNQNDVGIVKYSPSGTFLGATNIGGTGNEALIDIDSDAVNSIYVCLSSRGSFVVGSTNFNDTGITILKYNPLLNFIDGEKFDTKLAVCYGMSVRDNGESAIIGIFRDTINFDTIGLKSTVGGVANATILNSYVTYFDKNINPKWIKKGEAVTGNGNAAAIGGIKIRNGFIYFGGQFNTSDIRWDNSITMKYVPAAPNLFISKTDTLGNFLWAFGGGVSGAQNTVRGVSADLDGNGIVTGTFNSFVNVLNKSASGNSSVNFFTAKIVDFSITRGNVNPGPYCAGDSFDIPYTKIGRYDTGNVFIAQLSDSAGNFDGGERELGRLKDTADGTIKGTLPLFDVATTDKYRIRIISTKPIVQSFFRRDTLRLLIFSKDTANAGPDFWACKGEPVQLSTTGGSKWEWSPSTYMVNAADTSNRRPLIEPDSTLEYRIIISDSSGCGVTDTDYVRVLVRQDLSVGINGTNSSCRGQKVVLRANVTGGDSTYWYSWSIKDSTNVLTSLDSLEVSPQNTTTYQLVAGDSCTPRIDTTLFTLQIDTVLNVTTTADTTICKGSEANFQAFGSGCDTGKYKFTWVDSLDTATVLGAQAVFKPVPDSTTTYRVVLQDISTSLSDTAFVKATVDNVFTIIATKDSTICKGQSIELTADVLSCDTSLLKYSWDNGQDTNKTILVSPATTTTYKVKVTNNFNGLTDSTTITITVRDSLSLSLNSDTTICIGEEAELRATANGGKNSQYQIQWLDSSNNTQAGTNFSLKVTPTITTTYKAILSDGCTDKNDSGYVRVVVRDSLKIILPYTDSAICAGEAFALNAGATGGDNSNYNFEWTLPDASTVNQSSFTTSPQSSGTYVLALNDGGCTNYADTARVFVFIRAPLDVIANGKTEACFGETITLSAFTTGGDSSQYKFTWVYPDGTQNTGISIDVTPDSASLFKIIVEDNCSTPAKDSAQILLTVPNPIRIEANNDTVLCFGWSLPLAANITGGDPAKYKITWQGVGTTANDTIPNLTINTLTPGQYQYVINVDDNCALSGNDTIEVDVLPSPTAGFSVQNNTGCPPLSFSVNDLSLNHDSTLNIWRVTGNGFSEQQQDTIPQFVLTQSGRYNLFLKVSNAIGCDDSVTINNIIQVFDKPTANFRITPEVRIVDEPITFINQSSNADNFVWWLGENDSIAIANYGNINKTFKDTGTFIIRLIAINNLGCIDTVEKITIISDPFTYFIPNAFSPISSKGLNDGFAPVNTGTQTYSMKIFNRWGEILYDCDCDRGCDRPCVWDGRYKGEEVQTGIYSYIIRFRTAENRKKTVWGTVYVIR